MKFFVNYTYKYEMRQHSKIFTTKEEAIAFAKGLGDRLVEVINEKGRKIRIK